jgi:hypothetical protein
MIYEGLGLPAFAAGDDDEDGDDGAYIQLLSKALYSLLRVHGGALHLPLCRSLTVEISSCA